MTACPQREAGRRKNPSDMLGVETAMGDSDGAEVLWVLFVVAVVSLGGTLLEI